MGPKRFSQFKVARQRLQRMQPWAYGFRVSDHRLSACSVGVYEFRYERIWCYIATADYVAPAQSLS